MTARRPVVRPDSTAGFPLTQWELIERVRDPQAGNYQESVGLLYRLYFGPTYAYLRRRGYKEHDAKDLAQGFFFDWIERRAFGLAERSRGKFRTFLLTSLKHFVANTHRAASAKKRRPAGGVVNLDAVLAEDGATYEPKDDETPDEAFDRAWAVRLILYVLRQLDEECRGGGLRLHYTLFRLRVIDPMVDDRIAPPSVEALAAEYQLERKQVSNRLVTMRRRCVALLRAELRRHVGSDTLVDEELAHLRACLGRQGRVW